MAPGRIVELEIRTAAGVIAEHHRCRFVSADLDIFERYLDFSRELCGLSIWQDFRCSFSLSWMRGAAITIDATMPHWEKVIVLMHRLRPFVLKKEPTYFNRIMNLIQKQLKDGMLRDRLASVRDEYSGKQKQRQMKLAVNNVIVNSETTLLSWLNAFEYHRDLDNRREIEVIERVLTTPLLRGIFVSLLIDKAHAVHNLAEVIALFSGKQTRLEIS